MFVVIQEIETKKPSKGNSKRIEVYESHFAMNGTEYHYYRYRKSDECFERPIKKAYRISIHESYREGGKVRKKQTVICTIRHYDIVDYGDWIGDYVRGGLESKAGKLGLTEEELADMIYEKLQPIVDKIKEAFKQTEEYKTNEKNEQILKWHRERIAKFKKKYELDENEYDKIWDVFGELRNPEYLEKVKADYKARKEYEERSRSYQEDYFNNYRENFFGGGSSYGGFSSSNYNEANKAILKKFYRTLSKAFHPDSNPDKDTSEEMKMLNCLKREWGL